MSDTISELILRVFSSRDLAHLTHWGTDSYATHNATDEFYKEAPLKLDDYIEAYQGLFSKVKFKEDEDLDEELEKETDLVKRLQDDVKWIEKSREGLTKGLTPLENLLDEIVDFYASILYKLRFLK